MVLFLMVDLLNGLMVLLKDTNSLDIGLTGHMGNCRHVQSNFM